MPPEEKHKEDESWLFGKPIKYWLELHKKAETLGQTDLLLEIAELRAKVSFYESRIQAMTDFKNKIDK